jgi:hypothetical protein
VPLVWDAPRTAYNGLSGTAFEAVSLGASVDYAWLAGGGLAGLGGSPTGITLGSGLKQAWIVGFEGAGGVRRATTFDELGRAAGHIAYKFGTGKNDIFGFHPYVGTESYIETELVAQMRQDLWNNVPYPGKVESDYKLFEKAWEAGRTVIEAPIFVPEQTFYSTWDWLVANKGTPLTDTWYSFPNLNSSKWGFDTFNCVTYFCGHGLHILTPSGQVRDAAIPALLKIPGVKPWEPLP